MTNKYNWENRKLTDDEAADVRKRHKEGVSQKQLAKEYDVSDMTINRIVRNKSYKYLNPLNK